MALSAAFTVTLGIGYACLETASTALFVAQVGWQALAYALLLTALLTAVGTAIYGRASRRLEPQWLVMGMSALLFGGATLFWLLLSLTDRPIVMVALFGWSAVIRSATLAILWMMGRRVANLRSRDSRRSISLWGLSSQAAGFLLVIAAMRVWTAVDLIFIAAVVYGLGALFLLTLQQADQLPATVHPPKIAQRFVVADARVGPALYLAPVSLFLTRAVHYVVLYLFFAGIGARFSTAEEIAVLVGAVLGSATVAAIVIRRWLAPHIWRHWGIPTLLILLPSALLLMLAIGTAIQSAVPQPASALGMGLTVPLLLYWLDGIIQYTFFGTDNSVLNRLVVPDPAEARTVTSCAIAAAALTLTALMLLLFQTATAAPLIWGSVTFVVLTGAWLAVNIAFAHSYPHLLSASLRRRDTSTHNSLRVDAFDLPDKSALDTLERALDDSNERVQLYAVNRLLDAAPSRLYTHVPGLLGSPREQVRAAGLDYCRKLTLREYLPRIAAMVHTDPARNIRVKAVETLAAVDPPSALEATSDQITGDLLGQARVDTDDLALLQSALIVARRFGPPATCRRADDLIAQMVEHPDPLVRVAAAGILAASNGSTAPDHTRRLLHDPVEQVQSAALETAATLRDAGLLPDILSTMSQASLCARAQSILFQAGAQAIPVLEEALLDPSLDRSTRVALIEVCGAIDDSRTTALLLAQINDSDDDVRSTALTALQRLNYRAGHYMRERLVAQTDGELREAAMMISISRQISDSAQLDPDAASLLLRALEQGWLCRRDNALHRMVFLNASRPIGDAIENLQHVNAGRRRLANELLLISLSDEQQHTVRPFLADLPLHERSAAVQSFYPQPERSLQAALLTIKEIGLRAGNDWLRSCAAYALATVSGSDPAAPPSESDRPDSQHAPESSMGPHVLPDARPAGDATMLKTIERVLFLRSVDLFRSVPDDVLAWVAEAAVEVYIPRGQRFITQGEHGDALFIVISGFTDIVVDNKGLVATRGPKSVFGEMGVLTSQPRTASCIANTEITALKLERRDFLELMARTPQLALGIIDVLVQRLDDVSKRAAATSSHELATE